MASNNEFFRHRFPRETRREERSTNQDAAARRAVRRTAGQPIKDEAGRPVFTRRSRDDSSNPPTIREQIALQQHRIAQLLTNFVITHSAVSACQPSCSSRV